MKYQSQPKPLYNREDARRLAKTFADTRLAQGEPSAKISTRRMTRMSANIAAQYFARPSAYRNVEFHAAKDGGVVLRFSAGR